MISGSCHCGEVHWQYDKAVDHTTSCNCTICRRYGAFWAYDYENEAVHVSGPTKTYSHGDFGIGFHFCGHCGCVMYWRSIEKNQDGRRRIAVNLRMAEPADVADIKVQLFDGFDTFEPSPKSGGILSDHWF